MRQLKIMDGSMKLQLIWITNEKFPSSGKKKRYLQMQKNSKRNQYGKKILQEHMGLPKKVDIMKKPLRTCIKRISVS